MIRNHKPLLATVALSIVVFSVLSTVVVPMSGMITFPFSSPSLLPHRDYYSPVPLGGWLMIRLTSEFFNATVWYPRIMVLILSPLAGALSYLLARRFVSQWVAFSLGALGIFSIATRAEEALGGWGPMSIVVSMGSHYFLSKAFQPDSETSKRSSFIASVSGLIAGVSIAVKQSALAPILVVLFVLLISSLATRSRSKLRLLLCFAVGIVITILALVLVQMKLGIASQAFADLANSGGKNITFFQILRRPGKSVLDALFDRDTLMLYGVLLLLVANEKFLQSQDLHKRRFLIAGDVILFSIFLSALLRILLISESSENVVFAIAATCFYGLVRLSSLKRSHSKQLRSKSAFIISCTAGASLYGAITIPNSYLSREPIRHVLVFGVLINVLAVSKSTARAIARKGKTKMPIAASGSTLLDSDPKIENELRLEPLLVSAAFVSGWWFVAALSNEGTGDIAYVIPHTLPLIGYLWAQLRRSQWGTNLVLKIPLFLSILVLPITVGRVPAVWNGYFWPPIFSQYTVIQFGSLQGVLTQKPAAFTYNRIGELILDAKRQSGKKDPTIFHFGVYPITYSLTDVSPHRGLRCSNHWFDLCPNSISKSDLESFKSSPSDIIVWAFIPENAIEAQERIYGVNDSALRNWVNFAETSIASGEWDLIGVIEPSSENLLTYTIGVFVDQSAK